MRAFLIAAILACASAVVAAPKKIVLIAGPITGHPKDTHEYEKNVTLLKHLLDGAGLAKVEAHFRGWPENETTLDTADTIFFPSDGTDHNATNHPLYIGERIKVIGKQMNRGCGLVFFHWSTFAPRRFHDQITEWVGGYFDYETGPPPRNWYSAIQTWEAEAFPDSAAHQITRGVKPFRTQEEYYYRMRFRENDPRLVPILLTRPPNEKEDYAVGWAVERKDGGRGFGFTGGHFYKNWWSPDFRKLILNAVAWTAKLDVPPSGIASALPERSKVLLLARPDPRETARLLFTIEQDPRLLVHVADDLGKAKGYDLVVLNDEEYAGGRVFRAGAGDSQQSVRRGCAATLGLPPLSFDPPPGLFEFAIKRSGSQWTPPR